MDNTHGRMRLASRTRHTAQHRLESELGQTRYSYEYINATLSGEFTNTDVYILEAFDSSDVFKTQLMDFEHLIDPLTDIYLKVIDNEWITSNNGQDSMGTISLTSASPEKARQRMQTWDIFLID